MRRPRAPMRTCMTPTTSTRSTFRGMGPNRTPRARAYPADAIPRALPGHSSPALACLKHVDALRPRATWCRRPAAGLTARMRPRLLVNCKRDDAIDRPPRDIGQFGSVHGQLARRWRSVSMAALVNWLVFCRYAYFNARLFLRKASGVLDKQDLARINVHLAASAASSRNHPL